MLSKFVFWTGASDFVVGGLTFYSATQILKEGSEAYQQFISLMVLGMFLIMAASCLMWASRELILRYPIVFWQGLVRLTAAGAILFSYLAGLTGQWLFFLVIFDGAIGTTYVLGSMRTSNLSFFGCMLCKDFSH